MPKHHGTAHSGIDMLPIEVLVNFGLGFEVLSRVPVFWEVIATTQVLKNRHAEIDKDRDSNPK